MKQYIKWQIREWLPVFFVIFLLFGIAFLAPSSINEVGNTRNAQTNLESIGVTFSVAVMIFPLFALDYRYKKSKADTFMQAPFKERQLRTSRLLIGLIGILILFTLIYICGVLIIYFRQLNASSNYFYHYEYYVAAYFFLILFGSIEYFISASIASFSDNVIDAIFLLLVANTIRTLLFSSFTSYYSAILDVYCGMYTYTGIEIFTLAPSFYAPGVYSDFCFSSLILENEIGDAFFGNEHALFDTSLCIYLVMGLASFFYIFMSKEPSGEHAGSNGPRNAAISLLPHLSYILFSIWFIAITYSLPVILWVCYFVFAILEYCILAFYHRSFKLPKLSFLYLGVSYLLIFMAALLVSVK